MNLEKILELEEKIDAEIKNAELEDNKNYQNISFLYGKKHAILDVKIIIIQSLM